MNNIHNGQEQPKRLTQAELRKRLIIDLDAAKGRLERSRERVTELEKNQPTAFFEIKKAKDIAAAANAIVQLYAGQVEVIRNLE